jgi:hypothetical protein
MLLGVKVHPGFLRGGVEFVATASLPLQLAAEEAWMSIIVLHRIAARLRFC